jgi:hypothetical protein
MNTELIEHPNYILIQYWKPMSAFDHIQKIMIVGMERDLCSGGLRTCSFQFGSTQTL